MGNPLDVVYLAPLMERTNGMPEIVVGLIDGPVAMDHPDLARQSIRELSGPIQGNCASNDNGACLHGTYITGVLCAKRESIAPAICPQCTLLVRPIFAESGEGSVDTLGAGPFANAPLGNWERGSGLGTATEDFLMRRRLRGARGPHVTHRSCAVTK